MLHHYITCMSRLNKTESVIFVSLVCPLLPEDLHSKLILINNAILRAQQGTAIRKTKYYSTFYRFRRLTQGSSVYIRVYAKHKIIYTMKYL